MLHLWATIHISQTQRQNNSETTYAIHIIQCRDCPQRYIGQTCKKIETQSTEHKNAIKRHDLRSLPAAHTYDNCHTFNCKETHLLGRAQTKHTRTGIKRHGTVRRIIPSTNILTFLLSTYNSRQYVRSLLTMTLMQLILMLKTFQHLQHIN